MEIITSRDFRHLAEMADGACVSLLMPTHRSAPENKQDPIRFKNLVAKAEESLIAQGRRSADARKQLESLGALTADALFWAYQREGLAAYCTPKESVLYAVPFPLPERVTVGPHPCLAPLIPVVSRSVRYYVLALSPKQVRLFEATRDSMTQLDLPGWPEDFEQLAAYIDLEAQLQFHTRAAPDAGAQHRAAMFHGHPGSDDGAERKLRLREYCHFIDQRLQKRLGPGDALLILACDERLAAMFREVSGYAPIVDHPIAGNPALRKPEELRADSWKLVEPQLSQSVRSAVDRYHQAAAKGLAASGLAAAIPAAQDGRVDTLLVDADTERWGRYDPDQRDLVLHNEPGGDGEELVNLATIMAYRQGAAVYTLPADQMPEHQAAVAVLRY